MGTVWDALTREVRDCKRALEKMADDSAALTERLDALEKKIDDTRKETARGSEGDPKPKASASDF